MSIDESRPPTPDSTLAIIFGASSWPNHSEFQDLPGAKKSAEDFYEYLLDSSGLGLPKKNVQYLFDLAQPSSKLLVKILRFLQQRGQVLSKQQSPATDLIVYYVGHGGFAHPTNDYFLAIRSTSEAVPYVSSVPITALAGVLKEGARFLRRYVILDCCFSAAAHAALQAGGPLQVVLEKSKDALPPLGVALLASSGPRDPSKAPPGLPYTMFSGAMLEVLRQGELAASPALSLQDLAHLIRDRLRAQYEDEAVRPQASAPEQRRGNVDDVRLFPNPARRQAAEAARLQEEEESKRKAEQDEAAAKRRATAAAKRKAAQENKRKREQDEAAAKRRATAAAKRKAALIERMVEQVKAESERRAEYESTAEKVRDRAVVKWTTSLGAVAWFAMGVFYLLPSVGEVDLWESVLLFSLFGFYSAFFGSIIGYVLGRHRKYLLPIAVGAALIWLIWWTLDGTVRSIHYGLPLGIGLSGLAVEIWRSRRSKH